MVGEVKVSVRRVEYVGRSEVCGRVEGVWWEG